MSDQLTFEEAFRRLDEIVTRLESGDVPLDDALELWRQGEDLHRACLAHLAEVEGRIEELRTVADDNRPGTL